MTIADDPAWMKAAAPILCGSIGSQGKCLYPDCILSLQTDQDDGCRYIHRDASTTLLALAPLHDAAVAEAVEREREACLKICAAANLGSPATSTGDGVAALIAAAIRARKEGA